MIGKKLTFQNIVCSTGEIAKDYTDYLLTKHWRQLRQIIYEERGRKCQQCKKEITEYNLHHFTYKRIGKERKSDLKLLCYDCHEQVHFQKELKARCATKRDKNKKTKRRQTVESILSDTPVVHYYSGKFRNPIEAKKIYPVEIIK